MTLEQISYLSQSIAAFAVVISLIYLAVQVRQTERNQRAMMQQVRTDRGILLSMAFAEPSMAGLLAKLALDDPDLTPQEQAQLIVYVRSLALNLLDAHALHAMSFLSNEAFERACAGSRWFLAMPRARATWELTRPQFTARDAAIIEGMVINGVPLSAPTDQTMTGRKAREDLLTA